MNTLWSFGDSFSEEVDNLPSNSERIAYIKEYLNGETYKTWPGVVADKLNYNYRNHAATSGNDFKYLGRGNSNDSMFFNVAEYSSEFKQGDIVIIGFTNPGRYQVPTNNGFNGVWTILPNQDYGPDTERYLQWCVDRDNSDYYVYEIMQRFKLLESLAKAVGFTIYYWNWTGQFEETPDINLDKWILYQVTKNKLGMGHLLETIGVTDNRTIKGETNGKLTDQHWGKITNDTLGNIFYKYIKNNKT